MLIQLMDIDRARQAAKSLKLNLDDWGVKRSLTWNQDTVAQMLGHTGWAGLIASIETGISPSTLDEEADHAEVTRRREFQVKILLDRLGPDTVKTCGGESAFRTIARFVAPSGRPSAGLAFRKMQTTVEKNGGIHIPLSLEIWSEDGLFFWKDLIIQKGYEHVAVQFDPEAEPLYGMFDSGYDPVRGGQFTRFVAAAPNDNLDKLALLALSARKFGNLDAAAKIIGDAYNIGSWAWAPVARERRRRRNPIQWWVEPNTRPFMRVLQEKAMIDIASGAEHSLNRGVRMLEVILALNPADPLHIKETLERF